MTPSFVTRPAFSLAAARPFCRSQSMALPMSSPFSTRACLQSMMPAPVFRRSSLTSALSPAMLLRLLNSATRCGVRSDSGSGGLHGSHLGRRWLLVLRALGAQVQTLDHGVGDFGGDQSDGADRVVIAGNEIFDP